MSSSSYSNSSSSFSSSSISSSSSFSSSSSSSSAVWWRDNEFNGEILVVEKWDDYYFIGGKFTEVNGFSKKHLCMLKWNGDLEEPWNMDLDGYVYDLKVIGDYLYVGGNFTKVNDVYSRRSFFRINNGYSIDSEYDSCSSYPESSTVYAICDVGDGIIVGGDFFEWNDQQNRGLVKLRYNDGYVYELNVNVLGTVKSIVYDGNKWIYVGGYFRTTNNLDDKISRINLFRFDNEISPWNPSVLDGEIRDMVLYNNHLYCVGSFQGSLKKISLDEYYDEFEWDFSCDGEVNIINNINGYLYIGGSFNLFNGKSNTHIARVDENGLIDTWVPELTNLESEIVVNVIMEDIDNILIAGSFDGLNGTYYSNVGLIDEYSPISSSLSSFSISSFSSSSSSINSWIYDEFKDKERVFLLVI